MNSDIFEVLGYVQVTRFLSRDTIEAQRLIDASVRIEVRDGTATV